MMDDADTIASKIRKAKTDPEPLPSDIEGLANRPEAANLINIYAALAQVSREDALRPFAGAQFSGFKNALADLVVSKIGPMSAEMRRLMAAPAEVDAILRDGAQRANVIAKQTLREAFDIVGLVTP